MSRADGQPDNLLITELRSIESDIRELKTGVQYVDATMYEYSSTNASDLTGSLAASSGGNQVLLSLTVTATSVDGTSFISSFVPQLWVPGSGATYFDSITAPYAVQWNQAVSPSTPGVVTYWLILSARNSVSASDFRFKARIYATAPMTVSFARLV